MQSARSPLTNTSSSPASARSSSSPQFVQQRLPPILEHIPPNADVLLERFLQSERSKNPRLPMDALLADWKQVTHIIGMDLEGFSELGKLCASKPDAWQSSEKLMAFHQPLVEQLLEGKTVSNNLRKLAGVDIMTRFCTYLDNFAVRFARSRPPPVYALFNEEAVAQAIQTYKVTKRDAAFTSMADALCEQRDGTLTLQVLVELQPNGACVRCPQWVRLSIGLKDEETGKPDITNLVHHFQRAHCEPAPDRPEPKRPRSEASAPNPAPLSSPPPEPTATTVTAPPEPLPLPPSLAPAPHLESPSSLDTVGEILPGSGSSFLDETSISYSSLPGGSGPVTQGAAASPGATPQQRF